MIPATIVPAMIATIVWLNDVCGSTYGVTISAIAAMISMTKGRCRVSIAGPPSLATRDAEQPARPQHEHERHRDEQHHVRVRGIEHRRDADDLASDDAAKHRPRERS